MHRFPRTPAVALAALALVAGACGGGGGDDKSGSAAKGATKEAITVGGIFALSGPTSDAGAPYAEGVKAYVEYLNGEGGVEGHKVNFPNQDYKYEVPLAESAYQTYSDQGAVAIIGWGTADSEALRSRAAADKMPFIGASYAAPLADPKEAPYTFVPGPTYSNQMRMLLKYISEQEKGAQTGVAFFHNKSPFGESPLADGKAYIKDNNLKIAFQSYAMVGTATDYIPELTQAKALNPKYIIVHSTAGPTSKLLQNIASQGLKVQVLGLNYCADELTAKLAGAPAEGMMGINPYIQATGNEPELAGAAKHVEASGAKLADKPSKWIQGWNTARVFFTGIGNAIKANGFDKFKDRATSGPLILKALEEIKDFKTGVGPDLNFQSDNHSGMKAAPLVKLENGKLVKAQDALLTL
jgi:branched-chain amino acid transport system substrate-binding protein